MPEKSRNRSAKKPAPARRRVEFTVINAPGRRVTVAGSFNNWDPEEKVLRDRDGSGASRYGMCCVHGRRGHKAPGT